LHRQRVSRGEVIEDDRQKGRRVMQQKRGTSLCSATTVIEDGLVPTEADAWGTLTGMWDQIHQQTDEQRSRAI